MSTAKDIPSELLDLIILHTLQTYDEYEFHRRQDIFTLSLVSKAWRAASLRYIFDQALFDDEDDFTRWNEISTALPQVLNYVLSAMCMYLPQGDVGTFHDIPTMPAVQKFTWVSTFSDLIDRTPAGGVDRFLCSFPGVTQLEISRVSDVNDARWLLSHFPKLQSLRWWLLFSHHESDSTQAALVPPYHVDLSRLEVLEASQSSCGQLDWLVDDILTASPSPSPLRKIEIDSSASSGCPISAGPFIRLLAGVAGTLEEISFIMRNIQANLILSAGAEKIALHRLHSVTFTLSDGSGMGVDNLVMFRWMSSIIEYFPLAPRVKDVKFCVGGIDMKAEDSTDNVDIQGDGSFSSHVHRCFPALEVIILEVPYLLDVEGLKNRMRLRMGPIASVTEVVFVVGDDSASRIRDFFSA